ncbi:cytochrome P450 [Streptomyces sp. SID724]|uniref:cytochrome P450 n=1 Tax=Streptomyces sp. SID724 TaxID=2690324 RepID=UPI0013611D9E|nr:cytochrome P450 [Streptomyces sp. SID724]
MHRSAPRLSRILACAAVPVMLVAAGCSSDSGSDSKKNAGSSSSGTPSAKPSEPTVEAARFDDLPDPCGAIAKKTIKDLVPEAKKENGTAGRSNDLAARSSCSWNGLDDKGVDGSQYRWLDVGFTRFDSDQSENEAAAMAFILLFAGFETTVNLIGNGTYALLRHPGQRARLEASLAAGESALLATGLEELLRFDGPVEMATWRYATEALTLGGEEIAAGDPVLVVLAAADRDPERFTDPDTLDLARRDNQHLGYGHGIHYCLGAPLARLEGQTALTTLLRRLPDLRLAGEPGDLRWRGGLIMRGLRTLPVAFEPGSRTRKSDTASTL